METHLPAKKETQKTLTVMGQRLNVEPNKLYETLRATVFKNANDAEFLALMIVANEHRLNPLLKQIYAFPAKSGGIVPVVGVDGWISIVNSKKKFDGCDFSYADVDGRPSACTCTMYVKGRNHPVIVTEYYEECYRDTNQVWKQMPRRMLRHKAFMQCARVAFGLSGIYDEDEARDIAVNVASTVETESSVPEFLMGAQESKTQSETQGVVPASRPEDAGGIQIPPGPRRRRVAAPPQPKKAILVEGGMAENPPQPESEVTSPVRELVKLADKDGVGEDQMLVYAAENFGSSASTLEELGNVVCLNLIANWARHLPLIKEIVI